MIKSLQSNEAVIVIGGRFCPGLTRRLNNFVGKPLEKFGRETVRILDQVSSVIEKSGVGSAEFKVGVNDGEVEVSVESTRKI